MNQGLYEITKNQKIAKSVYKMTLSGDTSHLTAPGQFVNIKLDGFYLRRPISVCDYNENSIDIIYKVVGSGTEYMSKLEVGEKLDLLVGLGNGFDVTVCGEKPIVVGGGVGVPPMYNLAKKLISIGKSPIAVLGFNTADEVFYREEFESLGIKTLVATADGSVGIKGFVTDALDSAGDFSYVYTCGPEPMLKALYQKTDCGAQFSFEERMGCGFGACMGCTCETKYGYKRICRDGPVLFREEIVW